MKKINLWLSAIAIMFAASATLTACSSDDEEFEAPELTLPQDLNVQADMRDGAVYNLPVNITSEAGISEIVVEDVVTGKKWTITSFDNPNSISTVALDLSDVTESTQYTLSITATDRDGQTVKSQNNVTFSVNIPSLEIIAAGLNSMIGSTTDIYLTVKRGMAEVGEAVVTIDGTEVANVTDLKTRLTKENEYKYTIQVPAQALAAGQHTVNVNLTDGSNELLAETYTANVFSEMNDFAMSVPYTDQEGNEMQRSLYLYKYGADVTDDPNVTWYDFLCEPTEYDEDFNPLNGEFYELQITKDNNGRVTKIEKWDGDIYSQEVENLISTYEFTYDGSGHLTGVTENGTTIVSNVVYNGDEISSYTFNGKNYEAKYATAESGLRARVDYLDTDMTGRTFGFDGTEMQNPFYMEGLPAVIPGTLANVPLQFLYSKYLFKSFGDWNEGWTTEDLGGAMQYSAAPLGWTIGFIFM